MFGHFGDRQRIRRGGAQDPGPEVGDQRDLAFGRTTGHRHHHRAQPRSTIMRAQAAGDTALQLKNVGFNVVVNLSATKGIADETVQQALQQMQRAGISLAANIEELKLQLNA